MKTALIIIGIIAFLFIVLYFVIGYIMYRFAVVRVDKGQRQVNFWNDGSEENNNFLDSMDKETKDSLVEAMRRMRSAVTGNAEITSRDGLKLAARLIEVPNPRGIAILMHGYRSSAPIDFAPAFEPLLGRGFSLLIPDQRAHGDSEGKRIGYGVLERYDVVDWAKYAEERWGIPILVYGVSMGSATVMMGAGVGYPKSVRAIIADCGFTSAGDICRACMKNWFKLPPFPVYYGAKFWTRILAKYDLDSVTARKSLENLRGTGTKVLFVHGRKDDFVPYYMTEENIKAFDYMPESVKKEAVELFAVENAGHAQASAKDIDGYMAAVDRLLQKANI